jgi:hypothetical protein
MQLALDTRSPREAPTGRATFGRTFRESRSRPGHRWYSFVEGFSSAYLVSTLDELGTDAQSVYDPFGGAGTALLEASQRGMHSFYAEANPFMAFVIDTKVNAGQWALRNETRAREALRDFRSRLLHSSFARDASRLDVAAYREAFAHRPFFETSYLRHLVHALNLSRELAQTEPRVGQLAMLACAANIVPSSNMTRRADLRRRKPTEYKTRVVDVAAGIASSVNDMLADLDSLESPRPTAVQVAADCRSLAGSYAECFDLAITSPPYLNGTNYVRNTKLELVLLEFIRRESEMAPLRDAGVAAGITQASASRSVVESSDAVERVSQQLDGCAGDRRIPRLVRAYFSDMHEVLRTVFGALKHGGRFILDIGDSKFYGVHVPTHTLLAEVAQKVGFVVEEERLIARRYSRDKTALVQVDLHLRKA